MIRAPGKKQIKQRGRKEIHVQWEWMFDKHSAIYPWGKHTTEKESCSNVWRKCEKKSYEAKDKNVGGCLYDLGITRGGIFMQQ